MKIWNDVLESIGDEKSLVRQRNFTVYGNDMVVVEGQQRVVVIKEDEISFVYGNTNLKILGQKLMLKNMSKGLAIVCGKIEKIDF